MTCGDRSYKTGKATGGSLSFDKTSMQVGIRIDNEIPIDPEDASAYAGELGGIGGMIAATNALCRKFQVKEGTVTHGVDNDAALSNCFGPYEPTTLTPYFHIVKRIRAAIKKSPVKWIGTKVKAHQDEISDIEQLDYWAKANILADKQAKAHLRRVLGQHYKSSTQHMSMKDGRFKFERNELQESLKNRSFLIVQNLPYKHIGVKGLKLIESTETR